jgi:hypothetical protein
MSRSKIFALILAGMLAIVPAAFAHRDGHSGGGHGGGGFHGGGFHGGGFQGGHFAGYSHFVGGHYGWHGGWPRALLARRPLLPWWILVRQPVLVVGLPVRTRVL